MLYYVCSPPFDVVIPIMDDGSGPVETECSVYLVEANNRKEARWAMWNEAKNRGEDWTNYQEFPLTGITIEDVTERVQTHEEYEEEIDSWKDYFISTISKAASRE